MLSRMSPSALDALGLLAGTLTTVAFVPQVVKTWRTRSADDFSLGMLVAFATGVGLWLAYGLLLRAWPISIANGATLLLVLVILGVKLRGRPRA
jgi:MtN3 and saliva related transmembrane protein